MSAVAGRRGGILLHLTSLPSPGAIGQLGPAAEAFVDWLAAADQAVWQILPSGPPGFGDSPYGAHSSRAGNPLLISPLELFESGLLPRSVLPSSPATPRVDFARAREDQERILGHAFKAYEQRPEVRVRFEELLAPEASWLDDWSLFAALKEAHEGAPWTAWEDPLRDRRREDLDRTRHRLRHRIAFHRFVQGCFLEQWRRFRRRVRAAGVQVLGDLPIYCSADSVEVWQRRDLFELAADGHPSHVAGVPPDYFSPRGQTWGNPLYRWDRHRAEGFRWWTDRLASALQRFDLLRLDHFRGFEAFWRIPANAESAAAGEWRPGPGGDLFTAFVGTREGLAPLIAEDLGVVTPEVEALRRSFDLPTMRVLQFAFDEPGSVHLPHAIPRRAVVYTGTHDNDTTVGWWRSLGDQAKRRARSYLGPGPIHSALQRAAYTSPAELAILPAQDVLGLGPEARMNRPGSAVGNWAWRLSPQDLGTGEAERLAELIAVSDRGPETETAAG
ncbi:MAG: 4-alpha-glucanotransferase [Acidobacteriota bacterium]